MVKTQKWDEYQLYRDFRRQKQVIANESIVTLIHRGKLFRCFQGDKVVQKKVLGMEMVPKCEKKSGRTFVKIKFNRYKACEPPTTGGTIKMARYMNGKEDGRR